VQNVHCYEFTVPEECKFFAIAMCHFRIIQNL
jgi:hypothetical protein